LTVTGGVFLAIVVGAAALGAAPARELPPEAEKIAENVYRIGQVVVDTRERTVTCAGQVNMLRGPIEYLAVTPSGKRHESVLTLDLEPMHLQVALLLLGLEPGGNLRHQGDSQPPTGAPVRIEVRWRAGGRERSARLEEFAWDIPKRRPMEAHAWTFTGSRVTDAGFAASREGSLIASYRDPYAILNNSLPTGADDTVYKVNERIVPPVGTRVSVVLRPEKAGDGKEDQASRVGP
jgi:hypothetical protein